MKPFLKYLTMLGSVENFSQGRACLIDYREIARRNNVSRSTAWRMIAELRAAGLVYLKITKHRPNSIAHFVGVTTYGKTVLQQIERGIEAINEQEI